MTFYCKSIWVSKLSAWAEILCFLLLLCVWLWCSLNMCVCEHMQRMHGGSDVWPQITLQDKGPRSRKGDQQSRDSPLIRETCDMVKITLALLKQCKVSTTSRRQWFTASQSSWRQPFSQPPTKIGSVYCHNNLQQNNSAVVSHAQELCH